MNDLEKIRHLKQSAKHGINFYILSIIKTFLTVVGIIFLITELVNFIILLILDVKVTIQFWSIPFACIITLIISQESRNYLKNCSILILFYWSRYAVLKTIEGIKDEDERHQALKDFMDRELTMLDR